MSAPAQQRPPYQHSASVTGEHQQKQLISHQLFCSTIASITLTCGRRKRRAISQETLDSALLAPSLSQQNEVVEVEGGEKANSGDRSGRFLLYWITTTSTSTSTSYSTTLTYAVSCTPAGDLC